MKTKLGTLIAAITLTGCATAPNSNLTAIESELSQAKAQNVSVQNELNQVQTQNAQLKASVDKSNAEVQKLTVMNGQLQTSSNQAMMTHTASTNSSNVDANNSLLPPNAKAGECYARVLTPAIYRTDSKKVIKREAGYRINVSHPTYKYSDQRVLVKEASEVATIIPAKYEWKTERVLITEAHDHLKTVPAVYKTKTEKVLVKKSYSTWKKGRGPIEKIDNLTGEIMCLIEVPAEYKTFTSKVLVSPARVEKEQHEAVYKDVKKRIMVEAPKMVKRTIPATYKTVKVKRIDQKGMEKRTKIPALYQTITNRTKVSDSMLEWRSILCETNTTGDIVRGLQRALLSKGHNPGPIDGVIGSQTMTAVQGYQKKKGLAVGQLTIETIKSLGVSYN